MKGKRIDTTLRVDRKKLKSTKGKRKEEKFLVLLSNQIVVIGPIWWAMKRAKQEAGKKDIGRSGKARIVEVNPTKVRVNRIVTSLTKLLENIDQENGKSISRNTGE